ncbi:MAG: uroporphyrinogen decarboxylase family protein [Phycisphaerae bacterium]|nr:uroporphyrinogen decarboxylase family protein [Phycisphaerae bacterium]
MLEDEFAELIKSGGAKTSGGSAPAGVLTPRERFRRCMHFQTVDRVPHWEFGYWNDTIKRFHREGLPKQYDDNWKVERYFGCEHAAYVGGDLGTRNHRKGQTIEVRGDVTIKRDGLGVLMEVNTSGTDTIPHYLEFPIRDRASWVAFRDEFLPANIDERVPADIAKRGAELLRADVPVGVNFGSYLGWVRNWIGFENMAMMFYDNLPLVEEIVAHNAGIILKVLDRVLPHVSADFACGWEDICYNSGPICSPAMFDRVVMPHLRPVLKLLRRHGITVIFTDCDGDVSKLVPLWLGAGQNCMFPIEVRGGTDPVKLRKEYGREILLIGGVDKMALLRGREGVLAELKRLEPVVADGGFIPHVDHRVQADVPYDTYRYYVREKLAMLGWKKEEIAAIEPLRGLK